ncbi:alpha/beta fold hydrolase, partial [Mycoplasmopsis pulmonis]
MHKTKISQCKQLRIYVPNPKGNILYLHGFTSRFENHFDNVENLKDYNFFAINVPGHGESPFEDSSELNMESYAHFYKEFIEELKLDKVILYGLSMGGGIAIILQSLLPKDMVEKIILVNPSNRKKTDGQAEPIADKNIKELLKMIPTSVDDTRDIMNKLYYDAKSFFQTEENFEANVKRYYENLLNYKHLRVMVEPELRLRIGKIIAQSIEKIQAPTLLVVGENDKLIPTAQTVENFKDHKSVKIVYISKSGHMPQVENPKEYWTKVHQFLE